MIAGVSGNGTSLRGVFLIGNREAAFWIGVLTLEMVDKDGERLRLLAERERE